MNNGGEPSGESTRIILIIGAVAVVVAIILFVAFLPQEPEVDPYVVKLEKDVATYNGHIDSLNQVVDGLNDRLNTIRAHMDSARTSNQKLLASLRRVSGQLKEYQGLYREQQKVNARLVSELSQVRIEKDQATTSVKGLKKEVDSLNVALLQKTTRLVRLESNLEEAINESRSMTEAVTSVLVFAGTEEELKRAGYLKSGRNVFFRKNFRAAGFPDVAAKGSKVMRISLGETLALSGNLEALADRHGKLSKGDEYEVSQGPGGRTLVTFVDATLLGQRVLAILKRN